MKSDWQLSWPHILSLTVCKDNKDTYWIPERYWNLSLANTQKDSDASKQINNLGSQKNLFLPQTVITMSPLMKQKTKT